MARAGFIMQGARGKLGDNVFSKGEGGTIQRILVKPKNPQTVKQTAQRVIFATVNQAASALYPLINHSFEGVTEGKKSRRAFVKNNLKILRALAAEDHSGSGYGNDAKMFSTTRGVSTLIPNRYMVSKGSLKYSGALYGSFEDGLVVSCVNDLPNNTIQLARQGASATTWSVLMSPQAFISLFFGLEKGEQLTFVGNEVNHDNRLFTYADGGIGKEILEGAFYAQRLVLKDEWSDQLKVRIGEIDGSDPENLVFSMGISEVEQYFDMTKSSSALLNKLISALNGMLWTFTNMEQSWLPQDMTVKTIEDAHLFAESSVSEEWVYFEGEHNIGDWTTIAGGFVRSSLKNGKWKRSTCILDCGWPVTECNFGLNWIYAGEAWFQSNEVADDALYLDEGGNDNELT